MTTLSKEDVKGIAEILGWSLDEIEIGDMVDFAALARADLVAENERLKAEISILTETKESVWKALKHTEGTLTATRTALAAAEADNERLQKALEEILTTDWVSDKVRRIAKSASTQPRDDSALREMIAGVYAECAKACRKEAVVIVVDGKEERAYNNAVSDCGRAIRALAKKARHGS